MNGDSMFQIAAYQRIRPFFMSVPSDTDLWMFITSGGGLTAGRMDAEGSLFPYQTVDQLHDAHHHTGPVTIFRVENGQQAPVLWEPFHQAHDFDPDVERNLYKSACGSRVVFEEIRHDLGLGFSYQWAGCDEFGWVRTSRLKNLGTHQVELALLDGLRNILPFGAPLGLYETSSNLVDAYKRTDLDPETGLGVFSLTAGITDRAEALEMLRANTVWCQGLESGRVHLSDSVANDFRLGRVLKYETELRGGRGNYLVSSSLHLEPGTEKSWTMAADVGLDHAKLASLRQRLLEPETLRAEVDNALEISSQNLCRLMAGADGMQQTSRLETSSHHFANVLFNSMRGGIFQNNYHVLKADFLDFLRVRNRALAERLDLEGLGGTSGDKSESSATIAAGELRRLAARSGDADFQRLVLEYLPLHFGRRHGDPSRPWNKFSIRVRNEDGSPALDYQGNWRDIFQNWEALALSYPDFLPHMVAKFVNASTVDGFNPYRISRRGVDWEAVNPEDPWSNIGYWGDHQIIYLLKLLEAWSDHEPGALDEHLGQEIFSYAQVPYRLKPFEQILVDQADTITFDQNLDREIRDREEHEGTDARLLHDDNRKIYHANLFEKLLVPALSKLSNFVPQAGIWMNTQRPEWNDANNALAAGGVSLVTLGYLRRYLKFVARLLDNTEERSFPVSREVEAWFEEIAAILAREQETLTEGSITPAYRFRIMSDLGEAFSRYRQKAYDRGFSVKSQLSSRRVSSMFRDACLILDRALVDNRRSDGLYHTYNLLEIDTGSGRTEVLHLQPMLEGQVAALSSGCLIPEQAIEVLNALYASNLYREDQHSFMLYPVKELPGFLEKNQVPEKEALSISLLQKMLAEGDTSLILRDAGGCLRFSGRFARADDLQAALDRTRQDKRWADLVPADETRILELFEAVFQHQSYTGRSGYIYGYEGIGCIYWHMVAKLLLAVQENRFAAARAHAAPTIQKELTDLYRRIRDGLGYRKSVQEYGAFPSDPYSHTPADGGARQPGMTGQVKEEIITRRGELGLQVSNGCLTIDPSFLESEEFMSRPGTFRYFDLLGQERELDLPTGSLAFTFCQVPVVYRQGPGASGIRVYLEGGSVKDLPGLEIDAATSREIFLRSDKVKRIEVGIATDAAPAD